MYHIWLNFCTTDVENSFKPCTVTVTNGTNQSPQLAGWMSAMNSDPSGWSCKAEDPNGTTLAKAQQNNGIWQLLQKNYTPWNGGIGKPISLKPTYEGQCYFSIFSLKLKIYVLDHYWHLKVAKNDVKLMSSPNSLDKDVNLAQKKKRL